MTNLTNRKSFIIHTDSLDILDQLTDEQAGKLFKAISCYQKTGEINQVDQLVKIAITPFINQFKRDEEKYLNIVERNKTNISKRWSKNTTGKTGIPKDTKNTDSDSKSDSDSESKNKNDSKNKNFTSPTLQEITIPDFIDASLWNSFLEMRVSKKAKPTQKAIELIIKELTKFHNKGLNANESLENSIKSNWTGVFEPRNNNQSQFLTTDQKRRQNNLNASAEFLRLTSGDDNAGQ